jgi:hypothetical protein
MISDTGDAGKTLLLTLYCVNGLPDPVPRQQGDNTTIAGDEGFAVRVSVPPTETGHEIAVLFTPKKNTAGRVAPNSPNIQPLQFDTLLTQLQAVADDSNADDSVAVPNYTAHHHRPTRANLRTFERLGVTRALANKYPAQQPDRSHTGFKKRLYYSVVRGYSVGVFFDFWYALYYSSPPLPPRLITT